jgi:hypothetical protein
MRVASLYACVGAGIHSRRRKEMGKSIVAADRPTWVSRSRH